MQATKGEEYSSHWFLTSALDWVSGQRHARPRFTPGKYPPVPIRQEGEWASELVWTQRLEEKPLALSGIGSRSSSLYSDTTDRTTPALYDIIYTP
jgi:hypothetical protein